MSDNVRDIRDVLLGLHSSLVGTHLGDVCKRAADEIDRLRAELEELRRWRKDTNLDLDRARKLVNKATERLAEKDKRIARAMTLLDRALGDTDPDIEPDEHEDPVYWAMRALTGGSDE